MMLLLAIVMSLSEHISNIYATKYSLMYNYNNFGVR